MIEEVITLLKEFDFILFRYEPDIQGVVLSNKDIPSILSIGPEEWKWLEPLLTELAELRKNKC